MSHVTGMEDEKAGGPEPQHSDSPVAPNDRARRLMDGLEGNFADCTQMVREWRLAAEARGGYSQEQFKSALQVMKASTQIANLIARIAVLKYKGSIPQ
jgi:hypothetical protein